MDFFLYLCAMENDKLELITHTVDGNEVKELFFKPVDNVIRGFVQDPIVGQVNRDYWRCVTWRVNGALNPFYGGKTRPDLYLDMSKVK